MDFLKNIDFGELFGKLKDLIGKVDWGDLLNKVKPVLGKVGDFLKKTPSIFAALVLFFTVLVDPPAQSTPSAMLVNENIMNLIDATYSDQGIANDGEFYYTSGAISFVKYTALAKYDIKTGKQVKNKVFPVNWDLIKKGYDHIGGISYYDGKLYAAMESSKGKAAPCIAVFSADSLAYETSYDLPASWFPDGIAWVAVDPFDGMLYTANAGEASSIHAFKVDATMAHVKEIDLDTTLTDIQGGDFMDNILYLSCDNQNSQMKDVLSVEVKTGKVEVAFNRNVGKAEVKTGDITMYRATDGSMFHVVDYNNLVSVYIRSYVQL